MTDIIGNVNMAESKTKKKAAGVPDIPEDDFSQKVRATQGKKKGAPKAEKKPKAKPTAEKKPKPAEEKKAKPAVEAGAAAVAAVAASLEDKIEKKARRTKCSSL